MDPEGSPIPARCGSSLSVVKITPATRSRRGVFPFITHKFSDPEIEALYHLHSSNRKRMELFRIFLYALLVYAITQILIHACWVVHRNSPYPPHQLPKTAKDPGDMMSIRMLSPHILNPHDVRHEFDTMKLGPVGGHHHHQHHPNSLQNNPGQLRTFSKDRSSEPRIVKDFPIRLNPSFMSHQQHPALNDSTHPVVANQDYPSNQPFFHKPRTAPIQTNHPHLHYHRKRRESAPDPETEYDHEHEEFHTYPQTTRTDDYDMIYMVVSFVLLGATLLLTLLMLILPGFSRGNTHLPIIIWTTHILLAIGLRSDEAALPLRLGLGWVLLEIFLIWVTVPLRFKAALAYNVVITILHTAFVIWRANRGEGEPLLGQQLGANLILLLTTNALGILSFYLSDKKQRRAFLDTRQSLEMKLVIEEQAKEQERLLLSVLPEHLALKMRQDLGAAVDGQFKKIYMSRHENVSILYADIVGFTAISSTYSASELVKILNELFARFDRLADKYHQIRIKILGDCYYCICGAPEERTDHAVLCVHMGLSMVKAIKYVRETTNSPVDMRVGIHTGAILAGVLGQRQWQFDVYSKDVELANKMESSGMPGKVHISEATLNFLKDEFEVEPAFGERREEMLRIAGMKTYFITRVLKPFHETPQSKKISENGEMQSQDDIIMKDPPSDLNSTFAEDSTSAIDDNPGCRKDSELESYRLRLKEELISRDGYKDLSKQSQWLTLSFTDKAKEAGFVMHKEPYAGLSSLACPVALVAITMSTFLVISFDVLGLLVSILVLFILLSISILSAYETSKIKTRLKKASSSLSFLCSLDSKLWIRRLLAVLTILLLTIVNAVFTIPCFDVGAKCGNMTYYYHQTEPMVLPTTDSTQEFAKADCKFPAYLIIFCAFSLFSVTMLSQPGSWLKSFIILLVVVLHGVLINFQPIRNAFDCSEKFSFFATDLVPENWQFTLYIVAVYIVLFTLNRRLEKSTRVLFLWKTEVEEQREHATQLRHKNESLVYNILPQHVATHFLGSRKRKHEELYSQSYSEVGILFASMPNFSDFYTEETVNNQGLECLRFLNEVISDFDAILEHSRFADNIIKIKTIASTYMAASGLNPSKQAHAEDPIMTRWAHLALLVEFALELKITLAGINEQSFNHFVLKMGINHGPITAGVIGARKPHYDIWGNSVNVASRMESTGKAGCIQVTEETYRILKIFGYQFEQRGLVNVKGKGQLMTYYLTGKGPELSSQEVSDLIEQYQVNLKQPLSRTASHDHQ